MAQSSKNLATEGLRGQVGNFVFRRRRADGKIFVSRSPGDRDSGPSEAEQATRNRFQQATIYGRSVLADPEVKARYQAAAKPGQTAYNVAVADYFHAPDIQEVDLSGYSGSEEDVIRIKVTDNFAVQQVMVRIENSDATLVEEGQATLSADGLSWIYTATTNNDGTSGDKITVTATDRARNAAQEEQTLE
jgi:hypothetical protein